MWMKIAKYTVSVILGVAIGVLVGSVMMQCALSRMRPPLFEEYQTLQSEIYARYLSDGALPPSETLSKSAQQVLSENNEIRYSAESGLSYMFDKPYPLNIPLVGIVTFGLWWGGEPACIGESQAPKDLIHNAKLRANRGSPEGDSHQIWKTWVERAAEYLP